MSDKTEQLVLGKKEDEALERIARIYGVTKEEAASMVIKKSLANRVRLRTGKGPGKVYQMRAKK